MKKSIYNIFFPIEDKVAILNTLNQKYVLLDQELFKIFDNTNTSTEIKCLKNIHIDFYEFLLDNKFIIEDETNEVDQCIAQIKSKIHNDELYELHINPTMNCNFKCWYCYETHVKSSRMTEEVQQNIIKLVKNILKEQTNLKTFQVNLFGGEPLLYYDYVIQSLIPKIKEAVIKAGKEFVIITTTNGLLINDKMIDFFKDNHFVKFQITLDGYREQHNKVRYITEKRGSYDKIVHNIILLAKNNIEVIVRLNLSKETFNGIEKIMEDFIHLEDSTKNRLLFDFHQVWQEKEKDIIDKGKREFQKIFNESGFRVSGLEYNIFNKQCYADKVNNANINYNGDVFKCTARNYTLDNREGVLNNNGVIEWNEKYHQRMDSLFKNKPCYDCNIFPVCGGGCTQNALEKGNNYCVFGFSEESKLNFVKKYFVKNIQR